MEDVLELVVLKPGDCLVGFGDPIKIMSGNIVITPDTLDMIWNRTETQEISMVDVDGLHDGGAKVFEASDEFTGLWRTVE